MQHNKEFSKWIGTSNIGKGGILLVLLIVILTPLLILSFYNHPVSDDFASVNVLLKKGIIATQVDTYLHWTGRYSGIIYSALDPLYYNFYWGYKLNTIVLLLLLVIATYWLSGKLFKNLNTAGKIGITSLFFFAYLMRMPDVPSGIFWRTGTFILLIPGAFAFFMLGCIISYSTVVNRKWYYTLSCLLAIAIIGCYEIGMVNIDLIILLIALASILKKRALFLPISLLIVCIVFSILEIKAPGNNVRSQLDYPGAHQLLFSIKEAFLSSKNFLLHWIPFMLLIGLLLFDLLPEKELWNETTQNIFTLPPWLSFATCIAIPVSGLFICFWAMGEFPPLRTVNVMYFYFVAGMMYFSFSVIVRIKKHYPDFKLPFYISLPLYCILIFILVFRTNNINVAYKDLTSGTAAAYNKERFERHEFLSTFKGDSCMIDSIKDIPQSLFFSELPRDKNSWINTSFEEYYHKKYIGIKDRKPE